MQPVAGAIRASHWVPLGCALAAVIATRAGIARAASFFVTRFDLPGFTLLEATGIDDQEHESSRLFRRPRSMTLAMTAQEGSRIGATSP